LYNYIIEVSSIFVRSAGRPQANSTNWISSNGIAELCRSCGTATAVRCVRECWKIAVTHWKSATGRSSKSLPDTSNPGHFGLGSEVSGYHRKAGGCSGISLGGYLRRTMSVRGNNVLHSFAGREDNELMIY